MNTLKSSLGTEVKTITFETDVKIKDDLVSDQVNSELSETKVVAELETDDKLVTDMPEKQTALLADETAPTEIVVSKESDLKGDYDDNSEKIRSDELIPNTKGCV